MSRKDIIKWIVDRMLAHDDSITQELALTIEREARAEWGGQRIDYIAKHCGQARAGRQGLPTEVRQAVYQAGVSDQSTASITAEHGISRATLYRLLKRGPDG